VVVVHVVVPRKLTAKQKELIAALRDTERPAPPAAKDSRKDGSKGAKQDDSAKKRVGFWGKMKDSLGN